MRYIAEKAISFSMMVKGRTDSVRVSFTSLSTGGSTYSTEEENIIEAMEKSPMYGKFYHRAPECVNDTPFTSASRRISSGANNLSPLLPHCSTRYSTASCQFSTESTSTGFFLKAVCYATVADFACAPPYRYDRITHV